MKRAVRIGLLVFSHAFTFVFGAVETAGYLTGRQFARAAEDPAYRISVHFDVDDPDGPSTSFDEDVTSLEKESVPPTAAVVRLIGHLRGVGGGKARYGEAAKVCAALEWPKCDDVTLRAMRGNINP